MTSKRRRRPLDPPAEVAFPGMSIEGQTAMVAFAATTFGPTHGTWLGDHLGIEYSDCAEAIAKLSRREH